MEEEDIDSGDKLAMSFLDVISCGFGGAVLLGLIFMVVRHGGATQTSSPDFIHVTWQVQENNSKVIYPLINAVIRPPDGASFDLDIELFDLTTGRLKQNVESPLLPGEEISILGFSRFGERQVFQTSSGDQTRNDNDSSTPQYQLHITNPRPGLWQIGTRYQNVRNFTSVPPGALRGNQIKIDVTGITRYSKAPLPSLPSVLGYSEDTTNLSYVVRPTVAVNK